MSVFTKGVLATVVIMGVLFGMVYLLLSMILGGKLAYWVEGSVTFAVLSIMGFIWTISALGPTGNATAWQAAAVGPNVTSATFDKMTYNVADYPNGSQWQTPAVGKYIADLHGIDDTATEELEAKTIMDGLIGSATSAIPGVVTSVKPLVQGSIKLVTGQYTEVNILMEPATVKGKASILAVGHGVPSAPVTATALPNQDPQATVKDYLVKVGDSVNIGDAVLDATNDAGTTYQLTSTVQGKVAAYGPAVGSLVRPGVPFLIMDVSGQPGQPSPVTVVAARVRGNLHTPAAIEWAIAFILLIVHLVGLGKVEKGMKARTAGVGV